MDESVYDNPLWVNSREVFIKTHPLVTEEIIQSTECRINDMKERGLRVNLNSLPFRHTLDLVKKS